MPEYDILVDKYISMGYPVDRAKDYATLDWMDGLKAAMKLMKKLHVELNQNGWR